MWFDYERARAGVKPSTHGVRFFGVRFSGGFPRASATKASTSTASGPARRRLQTNQRLSAEPRTQLLQEYLEVKAIKF
jgi:hypothetical protein